MRFPRRRRSLLKLLLSCLYAWIRREGWVAGFRNQTLNVCLIPSFESPVSGRLLPGLEGESLTRPKHIIRN